MQIEIKDDALAAMLAEKVADILLPRLAAYLQQQTAKGVWGIKDVCNFTGKGRDWIKARIREGLPYSKEGRDYTFAPEAVKKWLDDYNDNKNRFPKPQESSYAPQRVVPFSKHKKGRQGAINPNVANKT